MCEFAVTGVKHRNCYGINHFLILFLPLGLFQAFLLLPIEQLPCIFLSVYLNFMVTVFSLLKQCILLSLLF